MKTHRQIAREIGVSPGYLSRMLNGLSVTPDEYIPQLMASIEVSSMEELRRMFPDIRIADEVAGMRSHITIHMVHEDASVRTADLGEVIARLKDIERLTGIKFTVAIIP